VKQLLQFGVLRLGFFQNWDVGIGVFPESKEIFVGGERPYAEIALSVRSTSGENVSTPS